MRINRWIYAHKWMDITRTVPGGRAPLRGAILHRIEQEHLQLRPEWTPARKYTPLFLPLFLVCCPEPVLAKNRFHVVFVCKKGAKRLYSYVYIHMYILFPPYLHTIESSAIVSARAVRPQRRPVVSSSITVRRGVRSKQERQLCV